MIKPPIDYIEHIAAAWHDAQRRLAPSFGFDPLPIWPQMSEPYRRHAKAVVGMLVNESTIEVNWWRG